MKTLLFMSSEWRITFGGGNAGISGVAGSFADGVEDLAFVMGTGLIRLGGWSGDWRRRTEGFIIELERILVPYWCWVAPEGRGHGCEKAGVATAESMRRRSLRRGYGRGSMRRPAIR